MVTITSISNETIELIPLDDATDQFIKDHSMPRWWLEVEDTLFFQRWFLYDDVRYAVAIEEHTCQTEEEAFDWLRATFTHYSIEPANDLIVFFNENEEDV